MLTCNTCNPDVEDLGFEMPDLQAQWCATVDGYDCCPNCGDKDIDMVVEGSHWYCKKCKEEFYDGVTAQCHIRRTWLQCPDCEEDNYYKCEYVLTLPDDRKFLLKSKNECFKIFKALYPDAEFDQEWANDRNTVFRENGGRW